MKSLPKLTTKESIFYVDVPSTGNKIAFKRMKVSDEKILLIAKQSNDSTEIYTAILQTLNNCVAENNFNVNDLTIFDLEYIFLKLRGQSISNVLILNYIDDQDQKEYTININIDDIKVQNLVTNKDFNIKFNDEAGIIMKYPNASLYADKDFLTNNDNAYQRLMCKCIDKIYTKDDVFVSSEYSDEELIKWLDDLDIPSFNKIEEFINSLPVLKYEVKYKNSFGTERVISLATLNDFFTQV